MFKVNNKNIRRTSMTSFWCSYCYLWTDFTAFSSVSIGNFEHVNLSKRYIKTFYSKYFMVIHGRQSLQCWNGLKFLFNPFTNVPHHKETSRLIRNANQLTGSYKIRRPGLRWIKDFSVNMKKPKDLFIFK